MANKEVEKVTLNKEKLMKALADRDISIRSLGRETTFPWSEKSIERGIRDGKVSVTLMRDLSKRMNLHESYLSDAITDEPSNDLYDKLSECFTDLELATLRFALLESYDYIEDCYNEDIKESRTKLLKKLEKALGIERGY